MWNIEMDIRNPDGTTASDDVPRFGELVACAMARVQPKAPTEHLGCYRLLVQALNKVERVVPDILKSGHKVHAIHITYVEK